MNVQNESITVNRRRVITAGLAAIASLGATGRFDLGLAATPTADGTPTAPPLPSCTEGDLELTPAQTAGPYFTPGSPELSNLRAPGEQGTPLVVTGYVLTPDCAPVAGAKLDFWQADGNGVYDNQGYHLRGHQFTDEAGLYRLETVVPGEYPGRTEHIHVNVTTPDGETLTSQLYFPEVSANEGDGIFDPRLLLEIEEQEDGLIGIFTFVVPAGDA